MRCWRNHHATSSSCPPSVHARSVRRWPNAPRIWLRTVPHRVSGARPRFSRNHGTHQRLAEGGGRPGRNRSCSTPGPPSSVLLSCRHLLVLGLVTSSHILLFT